MLIFIEAGCSSSRTIILLFSLLYLCSKVSVIKKKIKKEKFKRKVPVGFGKMGTSNLPKAAPVDGRQVGLGWGVGENGNKARLLFRACCVREEGPEAVIGRCKGQGKL